MVWISFTSTTTDKKETMERFGNGGTFFKLNILFGRDISALSLFPGERELLLLPNSVFEVKVALSADEVNVPFPFRHTEGELFSWLCILIFFCLYFDLATLALLTGSRAGGFWHFASRRGSHHFAASEAFHLRREWMRFSCAGLPNTDERVKIAGGYSFDLRNPS